MQNITFLGAGAMGSRVIQNLLKAGFSLTVWNRDAQKTEPLVEQGAKSADTPANAVKDADVIISMLRDNNASKEVWLGENGAINGVKPGTVIIESGTVSPEWCHELSLSVEEKKAHFLEAPVLGTRPQAEAGQLIYLVGGHPEVLASVKPLLQATSGAIHHIGSVGQAAAMKLAINAQYASQVAVLAETMTLLDNCGLNREKVLSVMNSLPTTAPAIQMAAKLMSEGKFAPMFPIELVAKDMDYVDRLSEVNVQNALMLSSLKDVFTHAVQKGYGQDNIVGIIQMNKLGM